VKIEPKSIGVGQYQHDVDQKKLKVSLGSAVESCVNRVGVDLNTASVDLLKYVSGINDRLATNIVERRSGSGMFRSRSQLVEIDGFGEKTFEQAAGFLRIKDGENPLDRTAVHPESYPIVERMAASIGVPVAELIENRERIQSVDFKAFEAEAGKFTISDIREELLKPGRDPRDQFVVAKFRDDVKEMGDLKEGMELEGAVTNVTNFGAFVDLGVHQDGLVHISELSHKYIQDAREAVRVGDIVKVKVIGVDSKMKRISLSIKALLPKPQRPPRPQASKKKPAVLQAPRRLSPLRARKTIRPRRHHRQRRLSRTPRAPCSKNNTSFQTQAGCTPDGSGSCPDNGRKDPGTSGKVRQALGTITFIRNIVHLTSAVSSGMSLRETRHPARPSDCKLPSLYR
jgi:uncharacterized protein